MRVGFVPNRKCSICGKPFDGFGNNPEPVKPYRDRCCDDCNTDVVLPLRIFSLVQRQAFAAFNKGRKQ